MLLRQNVFVVLIGVSNGLGRMIAGFASDRFAAVIPRPVFLGLAVALMSLATLFVGFSDYSLLYVSLPLVGLANGAFWSLAPVTAADLFGVKSFGAIYNAIVLAEAVGSMSFSAQVCALCSFFVSQNIVPSDDGAAVRSGIRNSRDMLWF